ncbi:MAG: class II aldolase/adducin family protein [Actinomycetota bacterium]
MDLKAQLARAGRVAVERGLVVGSGGNLSAREDGADRFLVSNSGTWLDRLDDTSFSMMDVNEDTIPPGANPSVEWRLHQLTYRARPDVNAIVHLHPQLLVLLDAAGVGIRQITTDHVYYLGQIGSVGYSRPGSVELATDAARVAEEHDVMILRRHGCSALGGDVDMALRRALNLSEAADLTFQSCALGCGDEINFPDADRQDLRTI